MPQLSRRVYYLYVHEDVKLLHGGLTKWTQEERPLETGVNTPQPAIYTADVHPELLSIRQDVVQAIEDPGVVLIDSLQPPIYDGTQTIPGFRAVHIPTAQNMFAVANLNPVDATLLRPQELAQLWEAVDLQPDQHAMTYCGVGYWGALNLFVLRQLGHDGVSLYDASLMEGATDSELPMETKVTC